MEMRAGSWGEGRPVHGRAREGSRHCNRTGLRLDLSPGERFMDCFTKGGGQELSEMKHVCNGDFGDLCSLQYLCSSNILILKSTFTPF